MYIYIIHIYIYIFENIPTKIKSSIIAYTKYLASRAQTTVKTYFEVFRVCCLNLTMISGCFRSKSLVFLHKFPCFKFCLNLTSVPRKKGVKTNSKFPVARENKV